MKKSVNPVFLLLLCVVNFFSCEKDPEICDEPLIRGPYLQMATSSSVIIRWKTCFEKATRVRYGNSPSNLSEVYFTTDEAREHEARLSGLKPDTKYYYRIETESNVLREDSNMYFTTPPQEGTSRKTRIWAIGDFGTGTVTEDKVKESYLKYTGAVPTDVWLWLGDNAYNKGTDDEFTNNVFRNHYETMLMNTCVWPVPGNHDYGQSGYLSGKTRNKDFPYFTIFTLPRSGEAGGIPSGTERYYSFNHSNIHFISLDTYGSYNEPGSPMYEWLRRDLAANSAKWTIVTLHHPPYSKGEHDSDVDDEMISARKNIVPLLEKFKVDLVMSGHCHNYERSFFMHGHYDKSSTFSNSMKVDPGNGAPADTYYKNSPGYEGTIYTVVGCSGKLGNVSNSWPHPAMIKAISNVLGSLVIDVEGNSLTGKFIDSESRVRDAFTIVKN